MSNELNDRTAELADLRSEFTRFNEFANKEMKRMSELIRILEVDNKKMVLEKQETDDQSHIRQEEIYTLLDQVRNLGSEN
jgi:hypothetical protein